MSILLVFGNEITNALTSAIGIINPDSLELIEANCTLTNWLGNPPLPLAISKLSKRINHKQLQSELALDNTYEVVISMTIDNHEKAVNLLFKKLIFEAKQVIIVEGFVDNSKHQLEKLTSSYQQAEKNLKAAITQQKKQNIEAEKEKAQLLATINKELENRVKKRTLELEEMHKKLSHQAMHDALTGLPNRKLFSEKFSHAIELAKRNKTQVAVLFLDLDRFKVINDTFGHHTGDELLIKAATRLKQALRVSDTIARQGGDEFTILVENVNSTRSITRVCEKVLACFNESFALANQQIDISVSVGAALYPNHGKTPEALIKSADAAMYYVKKHGKNFYKFYSQELSTFQSDKLSLEIDLKRAITQDQLFLLYQPKIDITTNKVVGCEALVRWRHPERGVISPNDFIPIAEESGIIIDIGLWVLKTSLRQINKWQSYGLPIPPISINISGIQLDNVESIHNMLIALAEIPVVPSAIEFELTESTIMGYKSSTANELLSLMQRSGYQISIDDFGTGYSSLSYLNSLPIDTLKIDQSFIANIPHSKSDCAIVLAIINIAKALGFKTCAEGVENQQQLDFLKEYGCDLVQGYYFAKPLNCEALEAFISQNL
ncbi:EAL domain-containing protein (plasmid) [Pseudoalteromonas sp. T1lg65]|uniref:putative bifunctional diguanylate cyclase/phosphodiesterase n=1 Tax=Pseudoalteromonas sp. T1lg65 TaxID=2077101 RepID=UPI003F7AFEEA